MHIFVGSAYASDTSFADWNVKEEKGMMYAFELACHGIVCVLAKML